MADMFFKDKMFRYNSDTIADTVSHTVNYPGFTTKSTVLVETNSAVGTLTVNVRIGTSPSLSIGKTIDLTSSNKAVTIDDLVDGVVIVPSGLGLGSTYKVYIKGLGVEMS